MPLISEEELYGCRDEVYYAIVLTRDVISYEVWIT